MTDNKKNFTFIFKEYKIFIKFIVGNIKLMILKSYWKDKIIANILFVSFLLNVFLWIFLIQNKKENDYPVILHYNLFFGVDYLGDYEKVYLIPFVGIVIIFTNMMLGYFLYNKEKLASYLLTFCILITQIFLIISGYLIININS